MKTKYYTSQEALAMMFKGKRMCIKGHNHDVGYYFDISYYSKETKTAPRLVEHNADGTTYRSDVNIIDNHLFMKNGRFRKGKNWMIAKPKDFGLGEFPSIPERRWQNTCTPPEKKKGLFTKIIKYFSS